jgi:hypothetical protein
MPIDLSLTKHTLAVLNRLGDHALPVDTLAAEVEIASGRSLTTQQIEAVLTDRHAAGHVATRQDRWGRAVWHITDAGRTALSQI